jgi:hypothetical protein
MPWAVLGLCYSAGFSGEDYIVILQFSLANRKESALLMGSFPGSLLVEGVVTTSNSYRRWVYGLDSDGHKSLMAAACLSISFSFYPHSSYGHS